MGPDGWWIPILKNHTISRPYSGQKFRSDEPRRRNIYIDTCTAWAMPEWHAQKQTQYQPVLVAHGKEFDTIRWPYERKGLEEQFWLPQVCYSSLHCVVVFWFFDCLFRWLNEWMDGWTECWMSGWMDGWMDGRMDEWLIGHMTGWMGQWRNHLMITWKNDKPRNRYIVPK